MTADRSRLRGRVAMAIGGIALTAIVLVSLVGCGVIGEKYSYLEWYSNYFEKYYVRWIEDFEKQHADEHVRINFRAMPSDAQQKVYTMLISHTLSDIIVVDDRTSPLLYQQKALEPVAPEDYDRNDCMPSALKLACMDDGTLAAWPGGSGLRPFLYYTRASLDEAKTDETQVPETFDEYQAWASKLFKWELDGKVIYGPLSEADAARARILRRPIVMIRGYVRSAIPFMLAFIDPFPDADGKSDGSADDFLGGPPSKRPFRFTDPAIIKGLYEYQRFFKPKVTAIADTDGNGMQAWQRDVYAGFEGANWVYGEVFGLDFQVTRYPHAPGRGPKLYVEGGSNGVSRESRHKKLAVEFTKFLGSADAQVDAYYGHGYLPCRYSAWKRLGDDAEADKVIREKFLTDYTEGHDGYVGVPELRRVYRDAMQVSLFVPFTMDTPIFKASSGAIELPSEEAAPAPAAGEGAPVTINTGDLATKYRPAAEDLAKKVATFTGQSVTVIVRGTPPDMIPARSFVMASPIPCYTPLLADAGVYFPQLPVWNRIQNEVIVRMLESLERENEPMTPEQAAAWAQKEAEDIVAGRK